MLDREQNRTSRLLSQVLRHQPRRLGLNLDSNGWVSVEELLVGLREFGRPLSRVELEQIVALNDKQRFAFSEDRLRIRANQGHSVDIDLGLQSTEPPERLYHGTARSSLDSIRRSGLLRGKRRHVHLSGDEETAIKVGRRHGVPAVLRVRTGEMSKEGHLFYLSDNRVWLVAHVPPGFLCFSGDSAGEGMPGEYEDS